jgi:hypothetical protein
MLDMCSIAILFSTKNCGILLWRKSTKINFEKLKLVKAWWEESSDLFFVMRRVFIFRERLNIFYRHVIAVRVTTLTIFPKATSPNWSWIFWNFRTKCRTNRSWYGTMFNSIHFLYFHFALITVGFCKKGKKATTILNFNTIKRKLLEFILFSRLVHALLDAF